MLRYRYTAYRDTQAEDARVICRCDLCGEAICEGYDYYRIGIDSYCEDCVSSSIRVAGEEDDE